MEEKEIDQVTERLCRYVSKNRQQEFAEELRKNLENIQREGFMNGYEYAIELLQESTVKKKNE